MKIPLAPRPFDELFRMVTSEGPDRFAQVVAAGIRPTVGRSYRHWDTLRQLDPPNGLTHEEWWLGIKLARASATHVLPLTDAEGLPFSYSVPDPAHEMLHEIDQKGGGRIAMSEAVTNPATRNQYLISSLIEESITSSQLEGATTTRKVAKAMIRSGRSPRTKSERMIVNNYVAMNSVREWASRPITADLVLRLQKIVTEGTLDDENAAGRLQRPGEPRVAVHDREDGKLLHMPPPADLLPARLDALCEFANGQATEEFLHPVVRSILVHFWLAYDHPFEDGNGRTARALFYWSMLRQGYWLTEFLSISRILAKAPSRYARAFLFTETDGLDATYFVLYQLGVVVRAIRELDTYLEQKQKELRETRALLRQTSLNHRQVDLVNHALRHPDAEYTFRGHAAAQRVVYQSARTDLLELERRGLLGRRVVGQKIHFWPAPDLADRLATSN